MSECRGSNGGERKERSVKVEEEGGSPRRCNDTGRLWKVWVGPEERERERERERKVDGTTTLALMRAIQLPQCTSNTISPSPTSNEPSTGTGVTCERVCVCVCDVLYTRAHTHTCSNTLVRIFKRKFSLLAWRSTEWEKRMVGIGVSWFCRAPVFVCSTVENV